MQAYKRVRSFLGSGQDPMCICCEQMTSAGEDTPLTNLLEKGLTHESFQFVQLS
jgi:hypothetical protein